MIDLTVRPEHLKRNAERCRARGIIIPTFAQLKSPKSVPKGIRERLQNTDLWDIASQNLFRITWKNEPVDSGGGFHDVANHIEIPPELSGVDARIVALVGKWFPTGSHKVGATFGCLVPRLVTGQFDASQHKAVWPSTGNFCRGGAYVASLLACDSIAILPEEMSQERFDWLSRVAGEVIKTPGGESNVKEIYDKVKELQKTREDIFVFNQFAEFGNYLFHYDVTGHAIEEVINRELGNGIFQGVCLTTGSSGTLACGDYLKQNYPRSKIAVGEALQCPTLLYNGFGAHRIEGIGDKHVPWIHNVRNTDMVIGIDDNDTMRILRLFNEPAGRDYLINEVGVPESTVTQLGLLGISSIANLLMCIKFAEYYELDTNDLIITVFTDSADMYQSRLREATAREGQYSRDMALRDYHRHILGISPDTMIELTYYEKKRIHNLKYYTWIEQQGFNVQELTEQWTDDHEYWGRVQRLVPRIDELVIEFNQMVGLVDE